MWKDIPEWEDLYEISDEGLVRNKITNRLLVGDKNSAGYQRVTLYNKNIKKRFFIHRMVAQLFLDNPHNYPEVNHRDGDKTNNNVNNLEFCSRVHNEREAHRIGIKKYCPFEVVFADGQIKQYEFAIDLANELHVTKRAILNYLQHKNSNPQIISINYIKA